MVGGVSINCLQRFGHIIPNPGFDEAERKFIAGIAESEVGCPGLLFSVTMFNFYAQHIPMLFSSTLTLPYLEFLGRVQKSTEYKKLKEIIQLSEMQLHGVIVGINH